MIIESLQVSIVLSYTWLCKHNLQIDWQNLEVYGGWVTSCSGLCLLSVQPEQSAENNGKEVNPDLSKVPEEFCDLKKVFNKCRSTALPPYRLYDCSFDFLSGTI